LELRPVAQVYGVTNLYKDIRNLNDVMELERKLSHLESKAARVIEKVHSSIGDEQTVRLLRTEVGDLRKFLFVMHHETVLTKTSSCCIGSNDNVIFICFTYVVLCNSHIIDVSSYLSIIDHEMLKFVPTLNPT
jgi:hypothetical protein